MKISDQKILEVIFTKEELQDYFKNFGDTYWNDTEHLIFIPIREVNHLSTFVNKINKFLGINVLDYFGIYINCNISD